MANRKSGGTAAKVIAWILALVLVAGIVAGVVLWQKDYIQFNFPTGEQTEETPDEDDQGGLVVEDGETAGMTLTRSLLSASEYEEYGVSPLAETAYTVTATIRPANASNPALDWTIGFANPESAWATGKTVTDYVTVTPTSDGALTATVACLQAFGEQIVVTATSRSDSEISGTTTCDYVKKLTSLNISFSGSDSFVIGETYDLTANAVYTEGTLDGVLKTSGAEMSLTEEFKEAVEAIVMPSKFWSFQTTAEGDTDYIIVNGGAGGDTVTSFHLSGSRAGWSIPFASTNGALASALRDQLDNAFAEVAGTNSGADATFSLDYTYTYGEDTLGSGTASVDVTFDESSLFIHVTNIDLDGGFVF